MLSELAQYAIQDFCSSHGWVLSTFEGSYKLPKDLFLVDKTLNLNVAYLPDKWLKSRSKEPMHKEKDIMSDSDSVHSSEMPHGKPKVLKKRKAKVFVDVENTLLRRNASRKARNVVAEGNSDVENEMGVQ
jgi:hypothetical protein